MPPLSTVGTVPFYPVGFSLTHTANMQDEPGALLKAGLCPREDEPTGMPEACLCGDWPV